MVRAGDADSGDHTAVFLATQVSRIISRTGKLGARMMPELARKLCRGLSAQDRAATAQRPPQRKRNREAGPQPGDDEVEPGDGLGGMILDQQTGIGLKTKTDDAPSASSA